MRQHQHRSVPLEIDFGFSRHPVMDDVTGVFYVARKGGPKGGNRAKTTARGGGAKSTSSRRRSHAVRSAGAGRSGNAPKSTPTAGNRPAKPRPRRGPGGVGREEGHAQANAGKGRAGTPKRAK